MAELLKHIYNTSFFDTYSDVLSEGISGFDSQLFMASFATPHWESLELKQRMAYLAQITDKLLPVPYPEKVETILRLIDALRKRGIKDQNLEYIFLADIITEHGLHDLKTSIHAIEHITQFTSFEFAGRPFFIRYPAEMMEQMLIWASHPNANVRRYASEGCRPRLPWGLQLKQFVTDPSPIIPILEQLKDDPSEYVRRSVANNLNDISKDHPQLVINIIRKWKNHSTNTDRMLKHAARSLLKKGHPEVLEIFGASQDTRFSISNFELNKTIIQPDESLIFSFSLNHQGEIPTVFRIEYFIWYVKANGQHNKKIFKIAEKSIPADSAIVMTKKHRFTDLTTRKHYHGTHKISLVINGNECETKTFELKILNSSK